MRDWVFGEHGTYTVDAPRPVRAKKIRCKIKLIFCRQGNKSVCIGFKALALCLSCRRRRHHFNADAQVCKTVWAKTLIKMDIIVRVVSHLFLLLHRRRLQMRPHQEVEMTAHGPIEKRKEGDDDVASTCNVESKKETCTFLETCCCFDC
jgi:hypothetical protein